MRPGCIYCLALLAIWSPLLSEHRQRRTKQVTHEVERRARLEPLNLALVERVRERDLLLGPVRVLEHERQVLAGRERLEAEDVDLVVRARLVVVRGVDEREREHALLLEVRLVDTRERAGDDREAAEESRLERGVLAGGALTVVVVTDDDPFDAVVTVVGRCLGDAAEFASDLVLDLVGLAVLGVDSADQTVLGDVLEVATVLQPRTASRDVIGSCTAISMWSSSLDAEGTHCTCP